MNHNHDNEPEVLAETELFGIWRSLEEDDTYLYHVEFGGSLTLHLTPEEWEEFVLVVREASA